MEEFGWTGSQGRREAVIQYGEGMTTPILIIHNQVSKTATAIQFPRDENGRKAILLGLAKALGFEGSTLVTGVPAEHISELSTKLRNAENELEHIKNVLRSLASETVASHDLSEEEVTSALVSAAEARKTYLEGGAYPI
jgi:hypothetical protein